MTGRTLGLNLDVAGVQGVEISDELRAMADVVIEDNQATVSTAV